jgi:hypothetical protein
MTETTEPVPAEEPVEGEPAGEDSVVAGVAAGAAPTYESGAIVRDDEGVFLGLEPAPMPQFQQVLDAGLEPVVPEGMEVALDPDSAAARARRERFPDEGAEEAPAEEPPPEEAPPA